MNYFIILVLLLVTSSNNLILNPKYRNGFNHWENTNWSLENSEIGNVAQISLKGATSSQLCTQPYPNNGKVLTVGVTFKSNKPGNQYISGTGYGIFFVRWYESDYSWTEGSLLTDATPKNVFVRKYFKVQNKKAATFQICAKAVAYSNKVFSLAVTNWAATQ